MTPEPVDRNLARVLLALVDRCGMRNVLLALAGIAYTRPVALTADDPALSEKWKEVAVGLEGFARRIAFMMPLTGGPSALGRVVSAQSLLVRPVYDLRAEAKDDG